MTVLYILLWAGVVVWLPHAVGAYRINYVSHELGHENPLTKLPAAPSEEFWDAIQQVETGGEYDPESVIGDNGAAIGPLQIHRSYYNDAVEYDGSLQSGQYSGYTYSNCMGPGSFEYSKKVGNAYMARYAVPKRLGHFPTNEDFARIHNGGPNGWRMRSTLGYWHKVEAILTSRTIHVNNH